MIQAIKGTRDILPEEAGRWRYVEDAARRVFHRYGFREIRTPIFESTDLFARGIGAGTDIVSKEMYTFPDRAGRSLTLRPESTAPVVRAAIEHSLFGRPGSDRLFYIGPMFRYERPQKGRMRQFHQIGVEAFGSTEPSLDAEGIEMAGAFLAEIGLTDTRLALNSVGCPACRPAYREKLRAALAPRRAELCEDCHRRLDENPLRILDCKAGCRRLLEGAPVLLDTLDETCRVHFEAVRRCLDLLGVRHEVDPHLVRGLDYYVRTTFEIEGASLGAQNALLGGGRYDGLVEELGGPRVPGFGFACGLDRIVLSLAPGRGNAGDGVDLFLAVSGAEAFEKALVLAQALRRRGLAVERDSDPGKSLKAQTRRADALGARFVLYLGEQELRRNVYTLKRLASGEQSERSAEDLDRLVAEVARG